MNTYIPINCSYYDELEAAATTAKTVSIVFRDDQAQIRKVQTTIKDLYTRNKEEFMVLGNGLEIRLDRLVSMDGKIPPLAC